MTAATPTLSIIILTWRDGEFLPGCIDSIQTSVADAKYEIILIENGVPSDGLRPTDTTVELRLIRNLSNRGVAAARNQGLRAARGRYLLLLDVDTRVMAGALDGLVHFLDNNPNVGLVSPRLVDAQGRLQLTCRNLPTLWSKWLRRIPFRFSRKLLAEELLAEWDHATVRDVDYVIGACQMIRRQALDQIGYLDERIFYGPEDIDYCIRMWQRGWRVVYAPQATVVHYEQRLTQRRVFSKLGLAHGLAVAYFFWKYRYLWHPPKLRKYSLSG